MQYNFHGYVVGSSSTSTVGKISNVGHGTLCLSLLLNVSSQFLKSFTEFVCLAKVLPLVLLTSLENEKKRMDCRNVMVWYSFVHVVRSEY